MVQLYHNLFLKLVIVFWGNLKMLKKYLIISSLFVIIMGLLIGCNNLNEEEETDDMGTRYYVSYSSGDDNNNGTSEDAPWKTLAKVSDTTFSEGDKILLKSGDIWENETLTLNGNGTAKHPIHLTSYGTGERPVISPNIKGAVCITGEGIEGWKITNLELANAWTGISLIYDHDLNNDFIWIENVYFHGMNHSKNYFIYEALSQSEKDRYLDHGNASAGISIRARTLRSLSHEHPQFFNQPVVLTNLTIKDCEFFDCDVAIWASGTLNGGFIGGDDSYGRINGITIENCRAERNGLWGFVLQFCDNVKISNFDIFNTGFESNRVGTGSALMIFGNDMEYTDSEIAYQYRHPDQKFDAVAFDTEGGVNNIAVRRLNIHNIAGYPILIPHSNEHLSKGIIIEDCIIRDIVLDYPGPAPVFSFFGSIYGESNEGIIRNNEIYITRPGISYIFSHGNWQDMKFENNKIVRAPSDFKWEFNMRYNNEGWKAENSDEINGLAIQNGKFDFVVQRENAVMLSPTYLKLETDTHNTVKIKMKNETNGTKAKLYWISDQDNTWDENKMIEFDIKPNDSEYTEYVLDMLKVNSWSGIISNMKLVPTSGTGNISIDEILIEYDREPVNIAMKTEVTSNSIKDGYDIKNVINGKKESINDAWASKSGEFPARIEFDFKVLKPIDRVEVHMIKGYEVGRYILEYSDGYIWRVIERVEENKDLHITHKFEDTLMARHIRITALEGSKEETGIARIAEIQIYRNDYMETTDDEELRKNSVIRPRLK